MKPCTEDAGDNHFSQTAFIRYVNQSHYYFKQAPQRICGNAPDGSHKRSNQQGMTISMIRVTETKDHYYKYLDINSHVGQNKYR